MGSNNPQSAVDPNILSADPLYGYLQALSAHQQPTRNADILNAMARLLTPQPQPSSTLPHPQPTPGVAYDPYARTTDSPANIQSRMGEVQPSMIQPADIAGMMAGSALTGPGRAVLGSERGAIGDWYDPLRKIVPISERAATLETELGPAGHAPNLDEIGMQRLRDRYIHSGQTPDEIVGSVRDRLQKAQETLARRKASGYTEPKHEKVNEQLQQTIDGLQQELGNWKEFFRTRDTK